MLWPAGKKRGKPFADSLKIGIRFRETLMKIKKYLSPRLQRPIISQLRGQKNIHYETSDSGLIYKERDVQLR